MGSSSRPGTNEAGNLVSLCEPCHREVESNRERSIREGYLVPQAMAPALTPIKHGRLGTVMLDNYGDIHPVEDE